MSNGQRYLHGLLWRRGKRITAETSKVWIVELKDSVYHWVIRKERPKRVGKLLFPSEHLYPSDDLYPGDEWKEEWNT